MNILNIIIICIMVSIIFGAFYGLYKIMKNASNTLFKLIELEEEAKAAKTILEVEIVFEKLKKVLDKCFHPMLTQKATIIKTILDTKYNIYKEMDEK